MLICVNTLPSTNGSTSVDFKTNGNRSSKEDVFFYRRTGLLELVDRTRRATDAAIPELNVNGSTSVDFKTNGNGCSK